MTRIEQNKPFKQGFLATGEKYDMTGGTAERDKKRMEEEKTRRDKVSMKGKKGTTKVVSLTVTLLTGGLLVAAWARFRAWRERVMPRRDPSLPWERFNLRARDGTELAVRRIGGGKAGALIVAHAAVTGQRYAPLVDLAEMLAAHFDVYTFDFRGHGESGGRLRLGLAGPLQDMEAVVEHVRGRGYAWLGAVGFSLGGMVSIVHAALRPGLDAVAAVGAPPALPDISPYRRLLPAWSLFLRLLGARFAPVPEGGLLPLDVAEDFPPLPLLVVHGEREVFYSRSDLEVMLNRLGNKVEFWEIAGAGHAELTGWEPRLVGWLVEKSGNRARHVPGRRA